MQRQLPDQNTISKLDQDLLKLKVELKEKIHKDAQFRARGISGAAVERIDNKLTISILLDNESEGLPKNVTAALNRMVKKFRDPKGYNLSVLIQIGIPDYILADEEVSPNVLGQFIKNILPLANTSLDKWFEMSNGKNYQYKLTMLRKFFESIVFADDLKKHFPVMRNHSDLRQSSMLGNCFFVIHNELVKFHDKAQIEIKHFIKRMSCYSDVIITAPFDLYSAIDWCLVNEKIKNNSNLRPMQIWSRLHTIQTLLEDEIDNIQELMSLFSSEAALSNQLYALKNTCEIVEKIFFGIEISDRVKLIGGRSLHLSLPTIEQIATYIRGQVGFFNILDKNKQMLTKGVEYISLSLSEEYQNNRQSQKAISHFQEVNDDSLSVPQDNVTSAVPNKTSLTFFANNDSCTQSTSSNAAVKQEALRKIEQEQRLEQQRRERNGGGQLFSDIFSSASTSVSLEENKCIEIAANNNGKNIEIFPLANTKHLFICGYNENFSPRDKDKFETFWNVVLNHQDRPLLRQDLKGKEGGKLYGLNCYVVKCKQFSEEHLLFYAHNIAGSEDYVYIPDVFVSHQDYEKLLNVDAKLLEARAELARNRMTVRFSQKDIACEATFARKKR